MPAKQIVSQENKLRAAGYHRGLTKAGRQPIAGARQAHADPFLQLKPGQHVTVDLPLDSNTSGRQAEGSSGAPARFSAAVVDLEGQAAAKAATECAVFLVPQARLCIDAEGIALWADVAFSCHPCVSSCWYCSAEGHGTPTSGMSVINQ